MIRLTIPSIDEAALQAVRNVLASGLLVQGTNVAAFERAVADRLGCRHAVAVSSGTAALHLALVALDVGPGDAVVVPAFSFVATANVVEVCGARPIFVDICPDTFNLDPNRLEEALRRSNRNGGNEGKVKAILPVHTFGQLADMTAVGALAARYGVRIVEDAACALGAMLDGRPAGTWGAAGCFSFHPRKTITTGEGGMLVTDDEAIARRVRALRNHGQDPDSPSPDFVLAGFNYRMTDFQAALGASQMATLDRAIATRRRLAERYDALLSGTGVKPPSVSIGSKPVYQSYVTLLPEEFASRVPHVVGALRDRGIETTIGTWHMPLTTYFRARYGHRAGDFPVTDDVFARALALPIYEALAETDQERVVEALLSVITTRGEAERA